jgi:hypothetical protein
MKTKATLRGLVTRAGAASACYFPPHQTDYLDILTSARACGKRGAAMCGFWQLAKSCPGLRGLGATNLICVIRRAQHKRAGSP